MLKTATPLSVLIALEYVLLIVQNHLTRLSEARIAMYMSFLPVSIAVASSATTSDSAQEKMYCHTMTLF